MKTIRFTKMEGLGNDYVYVDATRESLSDAPAKAVAWSDRHFGIGSDGLILIEPASTGEADFRMRMYNNDGSEGAMCGNGIRCVGKFVYDKGLTRKTQLTIETGAGLKYLKLRVGDDGLVSHATVDMGAPILTNSAQCTDTRGGEITLEANGREYRGTFVSMGNPHFVIFVDDIEKVDLAEEGPALEQHEVFPDRCNIEFVEQREGCRLRMRVWERGSGITMACGTGACATAVASILRGRLTDRADIEMDGGLLNIEWAGEGEPVMMTGPATTVFEGEIELPLE